MLGYDPNSNAKPRGVSNLNDKNTNLVSWNFHKHSCGLTILI